MQRGRKFESGNTEQADRAGILQHLHAVSALRRTETTGRVRSISWSCLWRRKRPSLSPASTPGPTWRDLRRPRWSFPPCLRGVGHADPAVVVASLGETWIVGAAFEGRVCELDVVVLPPADIADREGARTEPDPIRRTSARSPTNWVGFIKARADAIPL